MQTKVSSVLAEKQVVLRDTLRPVTPFGGLSVFAGFLDRIGFRREVEAAMPVEYVSPNAIPPSHTFTAFLFSVLAGARRFAHSGILRADRALHELIGIERFPGDDTVRNLFLRFGRGECERFFPRLWGWLLSLLPGRAEGYTLDMDSTVFERYGRQEGALKGYNPHKRGRVSHHPLLAVLAEANFVLHGWLRSGNCASARGAVAFLSEALARLPGHLKVRLLRADSGFFDQALFSFLEERGLEYMVVARMTGKVKSSTWGIPEHAWRPLDANYAVGERMLKLQGWDRERRFVFVRELVREGKEALGRKLIDVPGYTFRCIATNSSLPPEEVWRTYNGRADMENRISELKGDLEADGFCMRQFHSTDAAFSSVLLLFNLLSLFQKSAGITRWQRPATLRTSVFLCGAILGSSGRKVVLHMSLAWGGLKKRMSMLDRVLRMDTATSPKLAFG